jgi:Tfp pilus assembly protein PilE
LNVFTLIEGLLALAITGMLLVVALPTLHAQTPRSRVEMSAQYLVALSEVLERGYQQTQRYHSHVLMDFPDLSTDRTTPPVGVAPGPAFRFSLQSTPQAYTLTATALNGLRCTLTLNQSGARTASGPDCGALRW